MIKHLFSGRTLALLALFVLSVAAQTTTFTYQGKLNDSNVAANGLYDLQFKLYDAQAGGVQLETTQTREDVQVTNGIFTVTLDFTEKPFTGADVWLEIAVRPGASVGAFTTLTPRQKFAAMPYAIRSLLATAAASVECQGCLSGTQIGSLPAGNGNYIQNTNTPQASSNFNISGNGTAGGTLGGNVVNAATQFNLGGQRILAAPGTDNLFAGSGAGQANTTGFSNAFFGYFAGAANTTGNSNTFFGRQAGRFNTTGFGNAFFGANAGTANTLGQFNAFFGNDAGRDNTTGANNVFVGNGAGTTNSTGTANTFVGLSAGNQNVSGVANTFTGVGAGGNNTLGNLNVFVGRFAGDANTTGSNNTALGNGADFAANNLTNATAIGAFAQAGASNALVLGGINGVNGATADTRIGIGTTTPTYKLHVVENNGFGILLESTTSSLVDINVGSGEAALRFFKAGTGLWGMRNRVSDNSFELFEPGGPGNRLLVEKGTGNVGIGISNPAERLHISGNGIITGTVAVNTLGAAGATAVCRNASNQLSTCSSSRRYKDNIQNFSAGLKLVNQLRPVSFDWKADQRRDVGFVAEEVAALDPLLATYNDKGEIEGVKYAQLTTVLVNAVKEQQALIEQQQAQLKAQRQELEALKQALCAERPNAAVCHAPKL